MGILKRGSCGAEVKALQHALNARPYVHLKEDGIYGPQTEAAVREFQRRVRIALEADHMLPGDPNRVFNSFVDRAGNPPGVAAVRVAEHEAPPPRDPTTIKPQETNPFSGESS